MGNNLVLAVFAEAFNAFKAENRNQLVCIKTIIEAHIDDVADVLDKYAAGLKSSLGADAANQAGGDEDAQESAIAGAEAWVTSNVSNSSLEDRIAAVLWLEGCEAGEVELREHLPTKH